MYLVPKLLLASATVPNPSALVMYTSAGSVAGLYDIVTHMHINNNTNSPLNFSLWLGAATAGNEIIDWMYLYGSGSTNYYYDWYGRLRIATGTSIYGLSTTATYADVTIMGLRGVIE